MAKMRGGDRLDRYVKDLANKVSKPGMLRVGFLEGATYPDGTSVPMVAAIHNFGAPKAGIPPRPFFTQAIDHNAESWGPALATILPTVDYDGPAALRQMGEGIKGQVQQAIVDLNSPPLSPTTLMLRKMRSEDQSLTVSGKTVGAAAARVAAGESYAGASTKPLIDTSHMINSVDWEVSE